MSYELPCSFKYGMYSNGCYLAQELFKLKGVTFSLIERYGLLTIRAFAHRSIGVESIQDLNDFKSFVLNNGGTVDWSDFQDVLISLNSYTENYSIVRTESHLTTVRMFLNSKELEVYNGGV